MATRTNAATNMQSTTAGLVSWAGEIQATLTAGGWVQTADTGQTAAASLVGPGVINTSAGYQIWRMADALQTGASTVYVKFEFGEGAGTTVPSLWITIGTGSDGAGNITGVLQARLQIAAPNSTFPTSCTSYGSASTNRVAWFGSDGHYLGFSIERTKDASGVDTNEGLLFLAFTNSAAALSLTRNIYLRFTNNTLSSSTTLGAAVPSGATWADASGSNNIGVCPVRYFNGSPSNPGLSWHVYMNGDQSADQSITINIYNANHTYITLGSTKVGTAASSNANSTLAMLYE